MPRLSRLAWPDTTPGRRPALPPPLTAPELHTRLAATRAATAARGLDALAIYGDREHSANLDWLTGFDPRFEEAVLTITPAAATLIVGNECLPYAQVSPLVADGTITVLHCPSLSLISQPRVGQMHGGLTIAQALATAIPAGGHVGAAGWKYFGPDEVPDPAAALDWPAFLADPLRDRAARVVNATDLFMHPGHGLRARVDAAEIARLEFANAMAVRAMKRLVAALAEGATDFDVVEAAGIGGLPLGCHATFACGDRAFQGMSSPTGQTLRLGSPLSFNVCHWGANICRAGWIARGAADLPLAAQGTLEAFVFPYVQAMSDWCALMRPGVIGDAVALAMARALPADPFGVTLNPGHLIGTDEWMSSPIFAGSDIALASGMALQMDIIPGHPVHGSSRMEDGYVIADDALRADLTARFPEVAARCAARAAFMRDVIGMDVPDTLLPLADTCGIVAPWLLDAGLVVTLR